MPDLNQVCNPVNEMEKDGETSANQDGEMAKVTLNPSNPPHALPVHEEQGVNSGLAMGRDGINNDLVVVNLSQELGNIMEEVCRKKRARMGTP